MKLFTKTTAALLVLLPSFGVAQNVVTASAEYRKSVKFDFNSEWHYLSSDLYLFNAHSFSTLLQELYYSPKKKKKPDDIQNILITAKIDGNTLSGITYPIYNFNVDNSQGDMRTFTAANYEAVNIIDNLPLSAVTGGKIDAEINVDIISGDNPNKLYDFVAEQLTNISAFATPISATKTLVGELGSLIKAKSGKKEYRFSSTVRLYEEQDFNKRICGVSVYTLLPSQSEGSGADFSGLDTYLDTAAYPQLNRNILQQLITQNKYPFIVAVNYKSKYISEPVIGDEITTESIEARNVKAKRNYDNGLITSDIYLQETRLSEYLTQFVQLKNSINNYLLNAKNRTTDDFGKMFEAILTDYRTLRRTEMMRNREFAKNSVYQNEFKPIYQSVMRTAEIYLDGDNTTKDIKNIARMMATYSDSHHIKTDSAQNEEALRTLHAVKFPSGGSVSDIDELNSLITKIEDRQYTQVFAGKINKLQNMAPSTAATEYSEKLKSDVNATYCRRCRTEADSAIAAYSRKLDQHNKMLTKAALRHAIDQANTVIFVELHLESNAEKYFKEQYPDGNMPAEAKFLYDEYLKIRQTRENLQATIKTDITVAKTSALKSLVDDISTASADLKQQMEALCNKIPRFCE